MQLVLHYFWFFGKLFLFIFEQFLQTLQDQNFQNGDGGETVFLPRSTARHHPRRAIRRFLRACGSCRALQEVYSGGSLVLGGAMQKIGVLILTISLNERDTLGQFRSFADDVGRLRAEPLSKAETPITNVP